MLEQIDPRSYQGLHQLLAVELLSPSSKNPASLSPRTPEGFRPWRPQNQCIETYCSDSPSSSSSDSCESLMDSDSEDDQEGGSSGVIRRGRKGPYRKYTTEQKERAIIEINKGRDVKTVSKECCIPRRNLLRWKKNGCQRKQGGGRPSDFAMEERLFNLILNGTIKTEAQIREYALSNTNFQKFKASKGWFTKFKRRLAAYRQKMYGSSPSTSGTSSPSMSSSRGRLI